MIERRKLEKTLRMGLQSAQDSTLDEAVKTLMEYLELVLDVHDGEPPLIKRLNSDVTRETSAVETVEPLADLAPIDGSTPELQKTRTYWEQQALMDKVISDAPVSIEVTPVGWERPLELQRAVSQMPGSPFGVLLAYVPRNNDPTSAYPRHSFWDTQESIDVRAAVKDISDRAREIYRARTGQVASHPVKPTTRVNLGDT